jgi:hypothetical protein
MKMTSGFVAAVCSALVIPWAVPALAQDQTVKACRAEWQAHKADNQAKGVTEKAFIDQCRGAEAAKPAAAPAGAKPVPTVAAPAEAAKPATPPPLAKPAPSAATVPAGPNQFALEALAKAHCPADTIVWVNLKSKIYHFSSHKDYGTTKDGAYMCERDATGQGVRAAKNEKRPA